MTPDQIEQIIDMLAEKLGPMAEVVWEAYVTQAALTGARSSLIAIVFGILALIAGILLCVFVLGMRSEDRTDREFCQGAGFVDGVVFFVLLMAGVWWAVDAYMRVHNPAYYAIQMLLGR